MNLIHRRTFLKTLAVASMGSGLFPTIWRPRTTARAQSTAHKAAVLVIGAGAAGIAAARQLVDAGRSVIVIEARKRIGGRVWTDRSWKETPLDLGASWIHGVVGNPLTALAQRFKLKTLATDYDNSTLYDWTGRELASQEQDDLVETLEEWIRQVSEWGEKQDTDTSLQIALDRLWQKARPSSQQRRFLNYALNAIVEHEFAADASQLSNWYWNEAEAFPGDDVIFPNGYDQIFTILAQGLDVRLDTVVQQISYGADDVTITTNQGSFVAQQVVITLPLGVLKGNAVRFDPPLPAAKLDAIQRLGMGLLNKTYLRFPNVFWDEAFDVIGFAAKEKGHWAEWFNFDIYLKQPILLGFNAANFGRQIENLSDQKIVSNAMEVLKSIYGRSIPQPTAWKQTRWASDPFAGGSYSFMAVGSTPDDYDTLADAVNGKIFFAGEHTHRQHPATVHGALLSGQRTAREILALRA